MTRLVLVWLLLTNYLLVVGAGLVNRPEQPRYSAAHPYKHSKECQQHNYLRLDCFGTCNGDQHAVDGKTPREAAQHLLLTAKAVDSHYLPEVVALGLGFTLPSRIQALHYAADTSAGLSREIDAPPRRG
ncbi:MAG TPA: hypothetical protein VF598_06675 [Hymenobacter sp.]